MSINYLKNSLEDYVDNLSQKLPYPGGGSVIALVGALSSALISMVLNFTTGKKSYAQYEEEINLLLQENEKLKKELKTFIEEDSRIYKEIDALYKSKENPALLQEQLKKSANLHLRISEYMLKILEWNEILLYKGNRNLISDVGISAVLAVATFYGAKINAEINLKFIKDEEFLNGSFSRLREIEEKVKPLGEKIYKEVESKLS